MGASAVFSCDYTVLTKAVVVEWYKEAGDTDTKITDGKNHHTRYADVLSISVWEWKILSRVC